MSEPTRSLDRLERCGNAPCFDFVNTLHSRVAETPHEYLRSYADLVKWARQGELLVPTRATALQRVAAKGPQHAVKSLSRALELRESIHRIFAGMVEGTAPRPADLALLNAWLGDCLSHRILHCDGERFGWSWRREDSPRLDEPLWPVVLSAGEILAEGDPRRVRECPGPHGCGWLFYDVSKNMARRWCSMRTCGNLAKARRHARRRDQNRS